MNLRITVIALLLTLISLTVVKAEPYQTSPDSLRAHVQVLASDSIEGREVGSSGEQKATRYIAGVFESQGLKPAGTDGSYFQPFEFTKEVIPGENNRLIIGGIELTIKTDYEPLKNSATGKFHFERIVPVSFGITIDSSAYDDYDGLAVSGQAVLVKRFSPSEDEYPHTDFSSHEALMDKIDNAIKHEVSGLFFITPEAEDDSISLGGFAHISAREIPIFWLKRAGLEKLGIDAETKDELAAEGAVDLVRVRDTAYNVVGFLPGETDTAICIGAHHDHLGWGNEASLYRGSEPKIHPGADDNGSGSAALLELARFYTSRQNELHYSRLFIAFAGEERGLLGSNHFVKETLDDPRTIRMMMNIDMVGRLSEQDNGLAILGTGTCAEFKSYFDSLSDPGVTLTFKESGIGPSDHTPFYNKEIPVLFFFTGAHDDYHRPSDTWDKLDYDGLTKVTRIVAGIVDYFDQYPADLTFQTVKTSDSGGGRRGFSVTLGVMPDYVAEVQGLKIDAITPGKPAEKAGLQAGDIVIRMGENRISDIYAYMNALRKYKKGDSIEVQVERGIDTLTVDVLFD